MNDSKPWYQSKGVLGGIASGVAGVVMVLKFCFHVDISDLAPGLSTGLISACGLIGTVVAIWGRICATKQISSGSTSATTPVALIAALLLFSASGCTRDQNGKLVLNPAVKAQAQTSLKQLGQQAITIVQNTVANFAQSETDALVKGNFVQSSGDLLRTLESSAITASSTQLAPAIEQQLEQWLPDKSHWQNYATEISSLVSAYVQQHPNDPNAVNDALETVAVYLNTATVPAPVVVPTPSPTQSPTPTADQGP